MMINDIEPLKPHTSRLETVTKRIIIIVFVEICNYQKGPMYYVNLTLLSGQMRNFSSYSIYTFSEI